MCLCKGVSVTGRWTNPGVCLSKLTETISNAAKWGVRAPHALSEPEGNQTQKHRHSAIKDRAPEHSASTNITALGTLFLVWP